MRIQINEEMIRQMSRLQEQGQQADIVLLRKFGERWTSFTRNLSQDFDAAFEVERA